MNAAWALAVFLSGTAAVLFQTLWFRLAGLALGNSLWASSLVLSSFMMGLALGSGLAAWVGPRLMRPLLAYAALEVVTGVTGFSLVLLFPPLTTVLVPVFSTLSGHPGLVNAVRLAAAFSALLVPATAMGATLPALVLALTRRGQGFAPALGWLYGWNTLGAVAGALLGEFVFIPRLGLRSSGLAAGLLNAAAAGVGLVLAAAGGRSAAPEDAAGAAPQGGYGRRGLLAAAGLSGGILLALEVVWFRLLLLYAAGTSRAFAIMLAAVLLGIGSGGLLAGLWAGRRASAERWVSVVALASGLVTLLAYLRLETLISWLHAEYGSIPILLGLSLGLMFPTSFLSGILFVLLGRALREGIPHAARTTGALALVNTVGSAAGALVGGFVLLPRLGVEGSLVALGSAYALVAFAARGAGASAGPRSRSERGWLLGAAALLGSLVAAFPFGFMRKVYLPPVVQRFSRVGTRTIAYREGMTETIVYLRQDILGEPLSYRLITNGFSMSDTGFFARRYMGLFAYLPLALKGGAGNALLVSYGLGSTAKALTTDPALKSLDVVDISRDILEMGRLVYPPPQAFPLDDPRVQVHVEDGRFFLLTSKKQFDLITAEPPPPRLAGVVTLYSREYFSLARARLREGGMITHWLPVYQLGGRATRSVIRGFCDVFEDCSLWTGNGLDWILLGSRGGVSPPGSGSLTRLWRDPRLSPTVHDLGLEGPEALGALFLGDAASLRELSGTEPPLTDDDPERINQPGPDAEDYRVYFRLLDALAARERFRQSRYLQALWPRELWEGTLGSFSDQEIFNRTQSDLGVPLASPLASRELHFRFVRLGALYDALTRSRSPMLALLAAGSYPLDQAVVDRVVEQGGGGPSVDFLLALRSLSQRHYARAERLLASVEHAEPGFIDARELRALALCLGGDPRGAASVVEALPPEEARREFWDRTLASCPGPEADGSGPSAR